ncbi:MAG: class I SAM-dependent methyltransferase [Chloroflexi bacterium]|nr:class I SAM-dependent methyltransferase [Chloroflexota bacterium]
MHFTRFWSIVEQHHDIQNPSSPDKLDHVIDLLHLQPHQRVLDIGCGCGWLINRIASRTGAHTTGIEINPWFCRVAHQHAHDLDVAHLTTIIESDAHAVTFAPQTFDAVLCVGATFARGGLAQTLAFARTVAKPGAPIVIGDIFRYHETPPDIAHNLRDIPTLAELVDIIRGDDEPYELMVSTHEEWDRYETKKWQAARAWLATHTDDPEHASFAAQVTTMRHDYLHIERNTIGWTLVMAFATAHLPHTSSTLTT